MVDRPTIATASGLATPLAFLEFIFAGQNGFVELTKADIKTRAPISRQWCPSAELDSVALNGLSYFEPVAQESQRF